MTTFNFDLTELTMDEFLERTKLKEKQLPEKPNCFWDDEVPTPWERRLQALRAEIAQLQVQLAGCGVAALGRTSEDLVAKSGDYGWSASYQDVLKIRRELDELRKREEYSHESAVESHSFNRELVERVEDLKGKLHRQTVSLKAVVEDRDRIAANAEMLERTNRELLVEIQRLKAGRR